MKKLIALILALTMLGSLCACSSGESSGSSTKNDSEKTDSTKGGSSFFDDESQEEIIINQNAPVDIYQRVYDVSGAGTEAYLENLQKENPEGKFTYYNEEFYIQTITEKERAEMLEKLNDISGLSATMFEDFPGVYIGAEINDDLNQLTYQVNAEAYQNSMAGLAIVFGGAITLDQIQAYNLLPLDKRVGTIRVIDENGTVIFDTAES